MNEKQLSAKMKRAAKVILCFGLILALICLILLAYTRRSSLEIVRDQMEQEVAVYKKQILRQLDMDRQFLQTTASLLISSGMTDPDTAAESLSTANGQNDFITVAFFRPDGAGIVTTYGQGTDMDVDYHTLPQPVVDAIDKAMQGENAVSRLYDSTVSEQRVFTSAVPVISGSEIVGVLAASSHVEIFQEILNDNPAGSGNGFIHLIGSEGNFLVRSPLSLVKEPFANIFDGPYISESQRDDMLEAMASQESIFSSFTYQGELCYEYMVPVGVNGWYLFYLNTQNDILARKTSNILALAFLAVTLLLLVFLVYGSRMMQKNNRDLKYITTHDSLTDSINLERFQEKFAEELTHAPYFCLAIINIHQFKFINELFGNSYGDQLLREMKKILEKYLSKKEFFCRGTADAFWLYLRESDPKTIDQRIRQVFQEVNAYFARKHNTYQILMYAGAVLYDESQDISRRKLADFFTHAFFALDKARTMPPNTIWFFDTELHKVEKLNNYIESHMHQALEQKEFQLYLQPKFDLSTSALGGAEALVRWQTGDGRTIYPDAFIPLFEQNGFCVELDMYMLELVCRRIHDWTASGKTPIPLSVNQSKLLFYESNYTHRLAELMKKYQIPANLITLEILEGLALENPQVLDEKIRHLHELGFQVSMDDFGSGYSSFHTLGSLHIDELKLDRSFLLELSKNGQSRIRTILRYILKMTKELSIRTVAEGVETPEDENLMKSLGCDFGQGYLYNRPIPADEFEKLYIK